MKRTTRNRTILGTVIGILILALFIEALLVIRGVNENTRLKFEQNPCLASGKVMVSDGSCADARNVYRDKTGQPVTREQMIWYCEQAKAQAVFYEDRSATCKPINDGDDINRGA